MQSKTFELPGADPNHSETNRIGSAEITRLGATTGLLWRSSRIAIAGAGEHLRVPLSEAEAALGVEPSDFSPGHGPLALAALPFNLNENPTATIPEIVATHSEGRTSITAWGSSAELTITELLERLDGYATDWRAPSESAHHAPGPTATVDSTIPAEVWRDEIVARGVERIGRGDLNKVVLARELVATAPTGIDAAATVRNLAATFPHAIVFTIDGFIGASPELLVSRRGSSVTARPLAGTAARSADPAADQRLAEDLLASRKDRSEHRITIDWFLNELLPWCSYVDAEPEPSLLTVANVHHLQTLVEGVLSSPPAPVLDLVRTLHPTPAVGGDPQDKALALIAEIERAERGRYAGPTGWFDAAGNGAFAVSVRSAQVSETTASLFAGVGVVAGSDPQSELDETEVKAQAILNALTTFPE